MHTSSASTLSRFDVERSQRHLQNTLVVTVCKSFWASPESQVFPRVVYARKISGHSQRLMNSALTFAFALASIARNRPSLLLIGSSVRLVPWFIKLKEQGVLGSTKLVVTNQLNFDDRQAEVVDRIVVYSREEIAEHARQLQSKYCFIPLPADGFSLPLEIERVENRVFSGGGAGRDFPSLIDAIRGTDIPLRIVTFSRDNLRNINTLPANLTVEYRMPLPEFLQRMATSSIVVVPLIAGNWPHGHTTIVQALTLGKPVITTRGATTTDYVIDGHNGILVDAGDIDGYRNAIGLLYADEQLRNQYGVNAKRSSIELTYASFAYSLVSLCLELLGDS